VVQNGRPERGLVKFLPLVGQIAAGVPILASENVEAMIPVPADLVRTAESAFCLRVKGESMVGEGIRPRDLVIIRPQPTANHNDLIAARIDDEDDRSIVRLMPSNPAFEPIVASRDEVHVIGRVIGLWRDYDSMAF
jgi:repressor LexA